MSEFLDVIDHRLEVFGDQYALPADQLKVALVLVASIPLGFFQTLVKGPLLRNLYSFAFGVMFQIFLFRSGMLSTLLTSLGLYFLMHVTPRKHCGIIIFILSLAALSFVHIKRMIDDYGGWKMDISVAYMMFTCKYSYLSFSYTDGEIEKLPNLIEYLGFIYFYPAAIIGPTYNFVTYQQFIHLKGQFGRMPNRLPSTIKEFCLGVIFVGLNSGLTKVLPMDTVTFEEFGQRNFLMKMVYLNIYTLVGRFKYYAGWKLTQAGINASGISFSGYDEQTKEARFDLITTMDIYFEVEHNPRNKIELWNQSVQVWLKKCIYIRVYRNDPRRATLATYATFIVSAFWHGFYLAYYLAFLQFALLINATRYFYKAQHKFQKLPAQPLVKAFRWVVSTTVMNYIGGTFLLLISWKIWEFYKNFYFLVTIGLVVTQVFFLVTGWGQRSEKAGEKQKKNT